MTSRNYTEMIVDKLYKHFPDCPDELLANYALLVLTTGTDTTRENVHDAWSIWRSEDNPQHRAIIPFSELSPEVQELDDKYAYAIRQVASELNDATE